MDISYFTNKYHKLYFSGDELTPEIEAAIPEEYLALFQQGKGVFFEALQAAWPRFYEVLNSPNVSELFIAEGRLESYDLKQGKPVLKPFYELGLKLPKKNITMRFKTESRDISKVIVRQHYHDLPCHLNAFYDTCRGWEFHGERGEFGRDLPGLHFTSLSMMLEDLDLPSKFFKNIDRQYPEADFITFMETRSGELVFYDQEKYYPGIFVIQKGHYDKVIPLHNPQRQLEDHFVHAALGQRPVLVR